MTVVNIPPTLTLPGNQTVAEGSTLQLDTLGQFTDPGFGSTSSAEAFSYTIDWGDLTTADTGTVSNVTNGSPGVPTQGSFGGSHQYTADGQYTVTVTLSDGTDSTTGTFNVAYAPPPPPPPIIVSAGDLSYSTLGWQTLSNSASFSDPNSGASTWNVSWSWTQDNHQVSTPSDSDSWSADLEGDSGSERGQSVILSIACLWSDSRHILMCMAFGFRTPLLRLQDTTDHGLQIRNERLIPNPAAGDLGLGMPRGPSL